MKDYAAIKDGFDTGYADLSETIPDTAAAFGKLIEEATREGTLPVKPKELIAFAIAIAIAVRCDGCIAHHGHAALHAGATRQEVAEMIGVTVLMGGGPAAVYGVEALRAFDAFNR